MWLENAGAAVAASAFGRMMGDGHLEPKAPVIHRISSSTGTKHPPTMPPMQLPPHEALAVVGVAGGSGDGDGGGNGDGGGDGGDGDGGG